MIYRAKEWILCRKCYDILIIALIIVAVMREISLVSFEVWIRNKFAITNWKYVGNSCLMWRILRMQMIIVKFRIPNFFQFYYPMKKLIP